MDKIILLVFALVMTIGRVFCEEGDLEARNINLQNEIEKCQLCCSNDPREHRVKNSDPLKCEENFQSISEFCQMLERKKQLRRNADSNINKDCNLKCHTEYRKFCVRRGQCIIKSHKECKPDCSTMKPKKKCETECRKAFKKVCKSDGKCRNETIMDCKEKC